MNKEYIPRPEYIERIKPFIGKDLIKVFVGQRRVGKSYILYQLMDEIRKVHPKASVIYINKEDYAFRDILTWNDLYEYIKNEKGNEKYSYLFIDEIQEIKEFERALRSLLAEGVYDIYCTGSNARMLSGELATLLAGRYIEITVHSLSYNEFLTFHRLENNTESFLKYVKYGGMPWLVRTGLIDEVVFEYLHNIFNTIILKDVVERYHVRNVTILRSLILFLADNVGSIVSAKRISEYLKSQRIDISVRVVIEYLDYLSNVMLVTHVKRGTVEGRKIFEIGGKYYFNDIGLRNSIIPYRQADLNKLLENLVYSHLITSGYSVTIGQLGDKEIDFVTERRGEKAYFQVAYLIPDQGTHDREFGNLLLIKDNWPKYVVSSDEMTGGSYEGIIHIHIRDFLIRSDF
jgi:predicted AAA+ superfamily ATPase